MAFDGETEAFNSPKNAGESNTVRQALSNGL